MYVIQFVGVQSGALESENARKVKTDGEILNRRPNESDETAERAYFWIFIRAPPTREY